jgi:hypothetical protein
MECLDVSAEIIKKDPPDSGGNIKEEAKMLTQNKRRLPESRNR